MLLLPGSVALSVPRFSRLSAQINELDPTLTLKRAFFIYAVDVAGYVDGKTLSALLQPGTSSEPCGDELGEREVVVVAPRFGTISPWASKATNIAQNCGFEGVKRIERAVVYVLAGLHESQHAAQAKALLHDRMVEVAFLKNQTQVMTEQLHQRHLLLFHQIFLDEQVF